MCYPCKSLDPKNVTRIAPKGLSAWPVNVGLWHILWHILWYMVQLLNFLQSVKTFKISVIR